MLPWFVLPGRAHLAEAIGGAIWLNTIDNRSVRSLARNLKVSRSTVRGWIKRFLTQAQNVYEHCLYLLHSIKTHPPPVSDIKTGAVLFLFKLFSLTRFSNEHSLFWSYVSFLSQGRFLTNTTSPLSAGHTRKRIVDAGIITL
jgi:hypothetical protein